MPDEYDAIRRDVSNYERGLYFELGRAHVRGETQANGWVQQFRITIDGKSRILDSARSEGRGTQGVERKSGEVREQATLRQLIRERSGLESGKLTRSLWETVAGEPLPRSVREYMQQLARDFPGRFHHEVISRADAAQAIRIGQSRAAQQLELVRGYELNRADRARKRLEHIREISRARERSTGFRQIQKFRDAADRGRTVPQREERQREVPRHERQREVRQPATRAEQEQVIRQAKQRAVLELMNEWSALGRQPREQSEQQKQQERERQEREARQRLEREAADAAVLKARREAADRLAETRERHREAAERGYVAPATAREVVDILNVGRPTSVERERVRDMPIPRVRDDDMARGRARERERGREREP